MIKKLGEPTRTSISASGLSKLINYDQWNLAFQISESKVGIRCMTVANMGYTDEYGAEAEDEETD